MLHRVFFAMLVVISITIFCHAQYTKTRSGNLSTETWLSNDYVHITGDSYINSGVEITVMAGCRIDFDEDVALYVYGGGELDASDITSNEPKIFTSPPGNPTPGYWKALIAEGSSYPNNATINLFNCEIRYGGEAEGNPYFASGVIQCLRYANANVCQCYIHHNSGAGVCLRPIDGSMTPLPNLLVDSCRFEYCDIGVKVINGDLITHQVDVKRNWIEDCTIGMKLWAQAWDNNIKNNIIRRSASYGIYAFPNSPSGCRVGTFWNNVIDGDQTSQHGIYTEQYIGTAWDGIVNNIIINNVEYGIFLEDMTPTMAVYYDCFYGNGQGPANGGVNFENCLFEDPRMVEDYGEDAYYHLLWDSPCLGTGDDRATNSNPAESTSDIGAYGGPELDPADETILMSLSNP